MGEWIGVFGRLHPLVLHLPIGLLAGLALFEVAALLRRSTSPAPTVLVRFAAAAAALAAATGYTLSREGGYEEEILVTHLRLGLAVAASALALALFHARSRAGTNPKMLAAYRASLAVALGLLVPAGHFGSTLTHGEGFLTEPLRETETVEIPVPTGASYQTAIAPIFAARCGPCHGATKRKSGLALHEPAAILAGGKRGAVLVPGKPAESRMVERLRLPLDHEDHMPPSEKPQPTEEEIGRIETWIAAGAPFEGEIAALAGIEAAPTAAAEPAESTEAAVVPEIPPPDPAALEALARALVHFEPVERGSPLLWVDFAAVAAKTGDAEAAALLELLREQVEDLSLARSAIGDATLPLLARMPNLRRLDLRATAVTDEGLAALRGHERLAEIVLAQTRVGDGSVEVLLSMPALERVYLWQTALTPAGLDRLARERPSLPVDTGEAPEIPPTPEAPSLEPVNATCPVSGKPVDAEHRIVHRGKVVGFCCEKCPAAFWADPGKYESKIP